jgi:hypothetical protein
LTKEIPATLLLADHLSLHLIGIDVEMLRQMNPETQAVEEGAGAQQAIVSRAGAGNIGERIGRIGDDQYDRARGCASNFRDDLAKNFSVLVEQPQPALRIAAVSGATGFFIYAGGNHHQPGARQVIVVSVDHSGLQTKWRSVAKVGRDRLRAFARSVHDDDRPGAPAHDSGQRTSTPNPSRTNDSDLHDLSRIRNTVDRGVGQTAERVDHWPVAR